MYLSERTFLEKCLETTCKIVQAIEFNNGNFCWSAKLKNATWQLALTLIGSTSESKGVTLNRPDAASIQSH